MVLFWALVVLSSLIGSVSASMTALRSMSSDDMRKFWMLRKYLKQHRISRLLGDRILRFLEFKTMTKLQMIQPSQVALLSHLSEQLKLEMASEMNAPILTPHPLFEYLIGEIPTMMHRLSHTALKSSSHANE